MRVTTRCRVGALLVFAFLSVAPVFAGSTTAPATAATESLTAISPARLLDTRPQQATYDWRSLGMGSVPTGRTVVVQVTGRAGIPDDAVAAMLNITAVNGDGVGHVTSYVCGEAVPNASVLNFSGGGDAVANGTFATLDERGRACLQVITSADLIVDVTGFVPAGAALQPLAPARLFDSRPGEQTVDGLGLFGRPVLGGELVAVPVAGRGEVPVDAQAALLNVVAVDGAAAGHVTLYPCGAEIPVASTLNFVADGPPIANGALAKLDSEGRVCIYVVGGADVIVDVNGFVAAGSAATPLVPARLFESRPGFETIDAESELGRPVGAGETVAVRVAGRGGVPSDADSVLVNAVAVGARSPGHLTIYPCGASIPQTSSLNYSAGDTRANNALVPLSDAGEICVYAFSETDVVLDVVGYLPAFSAGVTVDTVPVSPSTSVAPFTTIAPTASPTSGNWERSPSPAPHPISGRTDDPRRWDPCTPIDYVVNIDLASESDVESLNAAVAEFEYRTGFDLRFVGATSLGHDRSVPDWADLALVYTDLSASDGVVGGNILGVAYSTMQPFQTDGQSYFETVKASVLLNADIDDDLLTYTTWLHEMAHTAGLGHVEDQTELMYALANNSTGFGPGDLEGLWNVGAAQGCLPQSIRSDRGVSNLRLYPGLVESIE